MSYWAVRTVTSGAHLPVITGLPPVVVEAANRFLREPIAQDRAFEFGIQRLEIQRRQHRLRGAAQVDGSLVGHSSEASAPSVCAQLGPVAATQSA